MQSDGTPEILVHVKKCTNFLDFSGIVKCLDICYFAFNFERFLLVDTLGTGISTRLRVFVRFSSTFFFLTLDTLDKSLDLS